MSTVGSGDKLNIDIEQVKQELKQSLSEKRYIHSVGVMQRAEELAKIYGIDVEIAKIVGLTHDIAKEFSKEEALKYAQENGIEIDEIEKEQPGLLHTKNGAHLCKNKYGFTDQMQKAIEYHATGDVNMKLLDKIIFVADKTEPYRKVNDLDYIVKLSNENLDEAMIYIIDKSMIKTMEKQELIHPKSILTRNALILQKRK